MTSFNDYVRFSTIHMYFFTCDTVAYLDKVPYFLYFTKSYFSLTANIATFVNLTTPCHHFGSIFVKSLTL